MRWILGLKRVGDVSCLQWLGEPQRKFPNCPDSREKTVSPLTRSSRYIIFFVLFILNVLEIPIYITSSHPPHHLHILPPDRRSHLISPFSINHGLHQGGGQIRLRRAGSRRSLHGSRNHGGSRGSIL